MEQGKKFDANKAPWHLLPGDALDEVVHVLRHGEAKYGERNWEAGMAWHRVFAAAMRHAWAWWRGQDHDPESGLHHLAHACCCLLFALAYAKRGVGTDDRPVGGRLE